MLDLLVEDMRTNHGNHNNKQDTSPKEYRVDIHDGRDNIAIVPVEPAWMVEAWTRGRWLVGLLILQSTSSFVLGLYEDLLREHLVVTLFLTMLVGAGGNAGNQSAIKVIRGMATGAMKDTKYYLLQALKRQAQVGCGLGLGLALCGFARVYLSNGNLVNAFAISASLFLIVVFSVLIGTGLPFTMSWIGLDPANAGTSIQVVMDILGVVITCSTCYFILSNPIFIT